MTKRDFELIAGSIAACNGHVDNLHKAHVEVAATCRERWYGIESVAHEIARRIEQTNPRFDRERFLQACGLQPEPKRAKPVIDCECARQERAQ